MENRPQKPGNLGNVGLEWLCELPLKHGQPVQGRIVFTTRAPVANLSVGLGFCDIDGKRILTYDSDLADDCRATFVRPGVYSLKRIRLKRACEQHCQDTGKKDSVEGSGSPAHGPAPMPRRIARPPEQQIISGPEPK